MHELGGNVRAHDDNPRNQQLATVLVYFLVSANNAREHKNTGINTAASGLLDGHLAWLIRNDGDRPSSKLTHFRATTTNTEATRPHVPHTSSTMLKMTVAACVCGGASMTMKFLCALAAGVGSRLNDARGRMLARLRVRVFLLCVRS